MNWLAALRFYTDNEEFLGDKLREQDLVFPCKATLFNIGYGVWAAAEATFYTGGQTRVNGRKNDDNLENSRVGAALALPVNRYNSLKLYYSTGGSIDWQQLRYGRYCLAISFW